MKRINSISGIIKVEVIRTSDVAFFRIRKGVAVCGVTPGKVFFEIPYSGGGELNTEDKPCSFVFNAPTPDNVNTQSLDAFTGVNLICKVTTNSGCYYVGSDRFPARLLYSHLNAAVPGEFAGYKVTVKAYDVSLDQVAKERVYKFEQEFALVAQTFIKDGKIYPAFKGVTDVSLGCPNDFDFTGKIDTYNNAAGAIVFDNKVAFPDIDNSYSASTITYSFNCNIACKYFIVKFRYEVIPTPYRYFLEVMIPNSSGTLIKPTQVVDYIKGITEWTFPINGIISRIYLKFALYAPYKMEIFEYRYTD